MTDTFIDPYIDLDTGILRNKAGAKTYEELRKIEADVIGMSEISLENIPRTNDLKELLAIHKTLFGRIYDWAGEIRTIDIRKGSDEYFLIKEKIETGAAFVFGELKDANYLKDLDPDEFVKKLSYFYEQLNFIHPFREGNGRTQRVFWSRGANDAGYYIDWSKVVGDELDTASLVGRVEGNLTPLENMFRKIVSKRA